MPFDTPYGENAMSGGVPAPSSCSKMLPVSTTPLRPRSLIARSTLRRFSVFDAAAPAISNSGLR